MAYDIVSYTRDREAEICVLQTHLWSSDPVQNAAYFRWRFADNPYLDHRLVRLALCDGRVVAMRGVFGTVWQVDDGAERHLLPHTEDFIIVPEHRNRGVASLIMQVALRDAAQLGYPFAVSLNAGAVTFTSSLAAGWRSAGSYQSARRDWTARPLLRRARKLVRRTLWPQRPFDRLDQHAPRSAGPLSLASSPRPGEMGELIARLPWDGRIRHVRDAEYFAWRFRNPLREYRFLFWDDGGLQGYLVLQRSLSDRTNRERVRIADWEAADERIRANLLHAALHWGRFAHVHAWTTGASAPVRTLLRDHSFVASAPRDLRTRSSGLLVRRLGDARPDQRWLLGSRDVSNIADWDLRMLYSMAT
jgi:GNAT superfamily N-acetyltransferase